MENDDLLNAVYVLEDTENAQFRYRVNNVIEISKTGIWRVKYYLKNEASSIDFKKISLLIIERQTAKDNKILKLIKAAQENGVKVLFDIDDLVFDYRDLSLVVGSVQEKNIFYWMGYFWGIRRIAKKVDGFLTTNDFLGEKLKRSFGKPYKVIPNSLNREQIEVSERCLRQKNHDGFVVGYFSGSSTHMKDFQLVEPELVKFLRKYENVKLRVVGYMEFSSELRKWIKLGRVETMEFVDYLKLQELMAEVDVNIAPLVINDFTNCKSELKFFEAAVAGTTTIASPTYTYKKAIENGENGFLAKRGEWYGKLEFLHERPKENKEIAKRAREYALKNYYGKEFLKKVEEAYGYFVK